MTGAFITDFAEIAAEVAKLNASSKAEHAAMAAGPQAVDPAEDIRARLAGKSLPVPTGYNVLVAIYVRPAKTKGGIILTDKTRAEDKHQGNVGLVLAIGPDAFQDAKFRSGAWCSVGDWILFPNYEGASTKFEMVGTKADGNINVVLCTVPDDRIVCVVANPAEVL